MKKPSISSQEKKTRTLILDILEKTSDPLSATDLFVHAESTDSNLDQEDVRRAIWYLVDSGKVEFTPDRRLTEVVSH